MLINVGSRLVLAPPGGVPGMEKEIAPLVDTEYCGTMLPISNVFAPASETISEMGALGCTAFSKSAQRPPQPVVGGWSGMEVCHCVCWSAWEKSCGGLCRPARYCARVIGINQRAGVEQKRQFALAEKRLQLGAAWMQTICIAVAVQ